MEINWLALVAAALSTLVVGFIWYNPKVFGTAWMKTVGMTEEKAKEGNMPVIFGLALVLAFVAAFFINQYVNHGGEEHQTFGHGSFHGALLALMVGMPVLATNALFEQHGFKYIAINVGYWMVCFAIMGGILCAWH